MEPIEAGRSETAIDSDESLFARYQRDGDKAAFEMLYERRTPDLRRFIRRQWGGGTTTDVEDILQETFKDLHVCRERVDTEETPIRQLLHKIAKCRLRDAIRAAGCGKRNYHRTQRLEADTTTFADTGRKVVAQYIDPKSDPAVLDTKIEVNERMAKLPPTEETALRLVHLEGHTIPSAAEALNLSESTTWSRVRSGRQRLKQLASTSLILVALLGAVADNCDLDVYMNVCTAETDEDEVCREDGGHHDSSKQSRKSLLRSLIQPDAQQTDRLASEVAKEITYRLPSDDEYPSIHKMYEERQVVFRPSSFGPSWRELEEGGTVLSFRAVSKQAVRGQSKVPRVIVLQAA